MFNPQDIDKNVLDKIAKKVGEMERDYHANEDAGYYKDAKTIKDELDGICWVLNQLGYGLYHEPPESAPEIKSEMWLLNH